MITGQIVGLRAIEEEDLPQLLAWRNNPKMRKYFREYRELNSTNQMNWFNKYVMNDISTRMFAIIDLKTKDLLGACGLCYIDWINRSADFSIYIGKNDLYIDEVYAIEAAQLMEFYGFNELNLHRLWAEIYSTDLKKQKFFHQLKFTQEGVFKETHWTEGRWVDSIYFAKRNG